jgi:hypothetical protein
MIMTLEAIPALESRRALVAVHNVASPQREI